MDNLCINYGWGEVVCLHIISHVRSNIPPTKRQCHVCNRVDYKHHRIKDSIEQILLAKKIIGYLSMSLHDHEGDVLVGTVMRNNQL
jgi:hypothetical protein